jgi:hypothetical protein
VVVRVGTRGMGAGALCVAPVALSHGAERAVAAVAAAAVRSVVHPAAPS